VKEENKKKLASFNIQYSIFLGRGNLLLLCKELNLSADVYISSKIYTAIESLLRRINIVTNI